MDHKEETINFVSHLQNYPRTKQRATHLETCFALTLLQFDSKKHHQSIGPKLGPKFLFFFSEIGQRAPFFPSTIQKLDSEVDPLGAGYIVL